jgi:hypothetical protein
VHINRDEAFGPASDDIVRRPDVGEVFDRLLGRQDLKVHLFCLLWHCTVDNHVI